MSTADALSRLPLQTTLNDSQVPLPGDLCHLLNHLDQAIVTASQIKVWTDKDPLLSRVRKLVQCGWNITNPTADILPFHTRYTELSVLDGCVLLGCRVIIPAAGQDIVLNQLHETHVGITKIKMLARSYVWWSGIDSDIQRKVQGCFTSPYHPSSNSLTERAVQTFKSSLKKLEGNVKTRLFTFLARYRVTPHSTTELLMGRKLRTTLDLMHPEVSHKVTTKLSSSSSRKPPRTFSFGDKVFAHNYHGTKI